MISLIESAELLRIGNFSVQTWGTIVAIGMIIAIILMLAEARKRKLEEKAESMLVFMIFFGLICGRLAYIAVNTGEFSNLLSWLNIWKGGIISWGVLLGVILGTIASKLITKIKLSEFYEIIDLMAPYLILAIAIGRIGCFLRGCCFGIPSDLPWAVSYSGGISVHPTQIYHSISDFMIFFLLLKLRKKKEKIKENKANSKYQFFRIPGSIFIMFLMLYSAERFFIDFLRYHPATEYFSIFSITQLMFLAVFIVASVMLKIIKKIKH
jgi:phosphatidylglycerol:prolipoprotein diacylglycerol transferase